MGSSRRLSCRQHATAKQAAGHAARLGPHGLSATSEGEKGRNKKTKGRTGTLLSHRDPTHIPNKGGQPGFRLSRATASRRWAAALARSAPVALLAAGTAGPLSADGKIPADGRGGGGLGQDARRGTGAG